MAQPVEGGAFGGLERGQRLGHRARLTQAAAGARRERVAVRVPGAGRQGLLCLAHGPLALGVLQARLLAGALSLGVGYHAIGLQQRRRDHRQDEEERESRVGAPRTGAPRG